MNGDLTIILITMFCAISLYFINKYSYFEYIDVNLTKKEQEDLEHLNSEIEELSQKMVLNKNDRYDDLTKIEGIGPRIQELLYNKGIKTYETLAYTYIADLQRILDEAGNNFNMANPKNWPMQAKLAYEGKWYELEDYQDSLYKNINLELDSK